MKENQVKKVELLSPAGDLEGFYAAIYAGADAVYLAGNKFGARAYADNFTEEELIIAIRYAHLFNKKIYLTVNTLVKEKEFEELYTFLKPLYEAGVDGVIVQDVGAMSYIKKQFPDMELHISTQATVTGRWSARFYKALGAVRIVPARELSLDEITDIKKETGLEIEVFVHGAMCYCYSGQCLFSSILGGRSGNRGRCAQPCRLPYNTKINSLRSNEEYPISMKDMCTIENISELIEADIDSFKIEGRMKKAEYTAGVTAIYRKYIDRYYAGKNCKVSRDDMDRLSKLYIRSEIQNGYYHKHNGRDMITLDSPAYSGSDDSLLAELRSKYIDRKKYIEIEIASEFITGTNAKITMYAHIDDNTVIEASCQGQVVDKASSRPIIKENIIKQLSKLGDTYLRVKDINTIVSEDAFYPLGAINELRRNCTNILYNKIIEKNGFPVSRICGDNIYKKSDATAIRDCDDRTNRTKYNVLTSTKEQLQVINEFSDYINCLYVESDLLVSKGEIQKFTIEYLSTLPDTTEIYIALPYIYRKRSEGHLHAVYQLALDRFDIFKGFLVRNYDEYNFLCTQGYKGKLIGDTGLYVWNMATYNFLKDKFHRITLPYELNNMEQGQICGNNIEKVVFGHIPMMLSANCILKTEGKCTPYISNTSSIVDRYNKSFPVVTKCEHCMNIIYNTVPLSLHNSIVKNNNYFYRLNFTIEKPQKMKEILDYFINKNTNYTCKDFTTGHEKRGVE